jgi:protein gp37
LRQINSDVRFVSFEPLIEDLSIPDLTGIDWAIVGGESGRIHRPMDQLWARKIRDACQRYGTAYFYKQDSGHRTELRPWLVEEDGRRFRWAQMPGRLLPPTLIE